MAKFYAVRNPDVGGPEIFNLWPDWTLTLDDVRLVINPGPDRENWVVIGFTFRQFGSKHQPKKLKGVDEWLSKKYLGITLEDNARSEFDGRVYDEWVAGTAIARGRYEVAALSTSGATGWQATDLEWLRIGFASTRDQETERKFEVLVPHPTVEHRRFEDFQAAQAAAEPVHSGELWRLPKTRAAHGSGRELAEDD